MSKRTLLQVGKTKLASGNSQAIKTPSKLKSFAINSANHSMDNSKNKESLISKHFGIEVR